MGNENKVHDFKNVGHRTLAQMAKEVLGGDPVPALTRIKSDANTLKHEEVARTKIHDAEIVEEPNKKEVPVDSAPHKEERGRILLFKPTGETVTVVRQRVGASYNGDHIHEVISREGKVFLASTKQLKERV